MCAESPRHLGKGAYRAPVASLRPMFRHWMTPTERLRSLFGNSSPKGRARFSPWNPIDPGLEISLSTGTEPWTNNSLLDHDRGTASPD